MTNKVASSRSVTPYLFVLPALAMLGIFLFQPIVNSFGISFTSWDGLSEKTFIGLDNFIRLTKDPVFWKSLFLTFAWAVMSATLLPLGGLILTVLVEYTTKSKLIAGLSRTVLFMPMMMSMVSVGLLWSLIYNPMIGLMNSVLTGIGVIDPMAPLNLLGKSNTALIAAFIPAIWQNSGFGMVIITAAMMNIPQELLDASSVDGAGKGKQFFHIMLPILMPTVFTCSTINMINAFKAFDLIYTMTNGGPGDSTLVTSIYMYRLAFTDHKFGYACTVATVMFLFVMVFTLIFNKIGQNINKKAGY